MVVGIIAEGWGIGLGIVECWVGIQVRVDTIEVGGVTL